MPLDAQRFSIFNRHRQPRELGLGEEHLNVCRQNIASHGWHIQAVGSRPGRVGWAYTIGFQDSLGHPDLAVSGIAPNVAAQLLNDLGDAIADGQKFALDSRHSGFLAGVEIEFRATLPRWDDAHFGRAQDWYQSKFPVWQVVVPDLANRFPGEPDEEISDFQLLLYTDQATSRPLSHDHLPSNLPFNADNETQARVIELLGSRVGVETGWDERLWVVPSNNEGRWIVVSVPYVDQLGFGDEVKVSATESGLRIDGVTRPAGMRTFRLRDSLAGGDAAEQRLHHFFDEAQAKSAVWEKAVQPWYFFAVPPHHFDWFKSRVTELKDEGVFSVTLWV